MKPKNLVVFISVIVPYIHREESNSSFLQHSNSKSNHIMSDSAVVVKTRKFMKNPLLSRKQVSYNHSLAATSNAKRRKSSWFSSVVFVCMCVCVCACFEIQQPMMSIINNSALAVLDFSFTVYCEASFFLFLFFNEF